MELCLPGRSRMNGPHDPVGCCWDDAGILGKGRQRKEKREQREQGPSQEPVREAPYEGTQMEKERNVWPHLLGQTVL